jgi:hypothetical protein
VSAGQEIELVFGLVCLAVHKGEDDTRSERDDGHGSVVPHELGVVGERGECLGERGGEGGREELDRLHEGAHVLRRLGIGVLECCDRGEDLGNGDEDVDAGDGPYVDGRLVLFARVVVVVCGFVAGSKLVTLRCI